MFRSICTLESWQKMSNIYIGAFFYVLLVLLVFAVINRRNFKNNISTRLLLTVFFFTFILQIVIYFCVRYERRYLAFAIVMATPLAVPGFTKLAELISKYLKFIDLKKAFIILIITAVTISAFKTLNPEKGKPWLHEIAKDIKNICPPGKIPVLLTYSPDERLAYYANATYIRFTSGNLFKGEPENIRYQFSGDKIVEVPSVPLRERSCIFTYRGIGDYAGYFIALDIPQGVEHFNQNVKRFGTDNIFIVVPEYDKNFKAPFLKEGVKNFDFTLVKEYVYKRSKTNVVYSLYRVNYDKNEFNSKNDDNVTEKL